MLSLKSILPAILSLAAVPSFAATTTSNCPQNWHPSTYQATRCCYGYMRIIDASAFCCVINATHKTDTASTATTSATSFEEQWAGADYCFKLIPFSASDYSNQVSSASVVAVATNIRPSANEVTSTSTSSGLSAASGSSLSNVSTSVTPTTNAAMPTATAKGVVIGGAGVAAALFNL